MKKSVFLLLFFIVMACYRPTGVDYDLVQQMVDSAVRSASVSVVDSVYAMAEVAVHEVVREQVGIHDIYDRDSVVNSDKRYLAVFSEEKNGCRYVDYYEIQDPNIDSILAVLRREIWRGDSVVLMWSRQSDIWTNVRIDNLIAK